MRIPRRYRIAATIRESGEEIRGVTEWDGLSSLYVVETDDGATRYVSVLDNITTFVREEA